MHRAINSLIGDRMAAIDGKIGKVDDFYFDELQLLDYFVFNRLLNIV